MENLHLSEGDVVNDEGCQSGWDELRAPMGESSTPSRIEDYDDEYYSDEDYDDEDYNDEDYEDDSYYYEDGERSEIKEGESVIHEIPIPDGILRRYDFLAELPSSIAVMGGAARSIAREVLTGEREPIRDIDLVNIVDNDGNSLVGDDELDRLGRKYMPDDYSFGHGITDDTFENYFQTRDFTINQVLVKDKKLFVSDVAQNDFVENIIRPSYYELPDEDNQLPGRLFLKAIMLQSVISQISSTIPLLEDITAPNPDDAAYGDEGDYYTKVAPFDIVLFLNKAMSRDKETAMIFVDNLIDWDVVSEYYANKPLQLAKDLVGDTNGFEFRPSMDERFREVPNGRDLEGFFIPRALDEYYSSDTLIAHKIAEYTEGEQMGEILDGQYSQEDFDWINS